MTDQPTDHTILELFRDAATRNRGFELLVRTYGERVYWLARRMVFSHEDANDVVQEVFIKVYENLHLFREESRLFSWIYRIATNEALAFIKRNKTRLRATSEVGTTERSDRMAGDPHFSGDEIQKKLHEAIQLLPPQQRLIFNMRYFEDLKYEEMSRILKLTEGALKASYHHAVNKIEKYLTGR